MKAEQLITKYRPRTLEDYLGNKLVKEQMSKYFETNTLPHVMLFSGETGTGKTTLAEIVRLKLETSDDNYVFINCAENTGVDNMRNAVINRLIHRPINMTPVVFVFDECHMLSTSAMSALLSPAENLPEWAYFIFCTDQPKKLTPALRGRCTTFDIMPLSKAEINDYADFIDRVYADYTGKPCPIDDAYIIELFNATGGRLRETLTQLENIFTYDDYTDYQIQTQADKEQLVSLAKTILFSSNWSELQAMLNKLPADFKEESARRGILAYTNKVMLNNKTADVTTKKCSFVVDTFNRPFYDSGMAGFVNACYKCVKNV